VVEFLIWIIETKSAFLPREKTAVLEDKLQSFDKGSVCPLIGLLIARELYSLAVYQVAMDIAKRLVVAIVFNLTDILPTGTHCIGDLMT
jgi:hypothetical protein